MTDMNSSPIVITGYKISEKMRAVTENLQATVKDHDKTTKAEAKKMNINYLPDAIIRTIFGMLSPSYFFIAPVSKHFNCLYREFDDGRCMTDPCNISTKSDLGIYFSELSPVWEGKEGDAVPNNVTDVVVNEMVEEIPNDCFCGCENIVAIRITDNVKVIGALAFMYCTSLKSIALPEGVEKIGHQVFYSCTSLESVIIPRSVKTIGEGAFQYCELLKSIVVPDGVEKIGNYAFHHCTSLESIEIPRSVKIIGKRAFMFCTSLVSIRIPVGVTHIAADAFDECPSLVSINAPNRAMPIIGGSFKYNSKI